LSIQVTDFNIIIICAVHFAFNTTANAHQCKRLDVLAAESSCSNQESFYLTKLFLDITAKNLDLIVISAVSWSAVNFTFRNRLENVVE
jgi:hypothetical protein